MIRYTFRNEANKDITFVLLTELRLPQKEAFEKVKPWIDEYGRSVSAFPSTIYLRLTSDGQVIREDDPQA